MVGRWQVPVGDVAVTATDYVGHTGEAMAMGERPPVALIDAARASRLAIAEAITNLAAAPFAALGDVKLSCNWMAAAGWPGEDARLYDAVAAASAFAIALGVAVPVGKDSMAMKTVWRDAYQQINEFERWLGDDGQVLIKFWMHISKKEQKKRFRECLNDPQLRWKITKEYRRHHRHYRRWANAVEEMLAKTDTPYAPWTIIEANDLRWARVRVFETLVERIKDALARRKAQPAAVSRTASAAASMKEIRVRRLMKDADRARAEEKEEAEAGIPA
jgi:hypothetical protein